LVVSKIALLPYLEFDMEYYRQGVEILNPALFTFPLFAKSGQGFSPWVDWLKASVAQMKMYGESATSDNS
jgi:hydrogenase nickel incorporation protein HypB